MKLIEALPNMDDNPFKQIEEKDEIIMINEELEH